MFDGLYEIESSLITRLRDMKAAAGDMRDLFKDNGLGCDADAWSAVSCLLSQALDRFGD